MKCTLTIIKWDKYNPRRDYKTPVWFALSNRVLEDTDLWDFDPIEFKAFIYILCQASQKKSATITINFDHAARVSNLDRDVMLRTFDKLVKIGVIEIDLRTEEDSVQASVQTSVRPSVLHTTDKTDITNKTITPASPEFDFETPYREYPRKEGKAAGMKRVKTLIRDPETFEAFCKATRNYAAKCRLENTETRFMKHWSSFVGTKGAEPWRDYVEWVPDPGALPSPTTAPNSPDPMTAKVFEAIRKFPPGDEGISAFFGEDWSWVSRSGVLRRARSAQDNDFGRKEISNLLKDARNNHGNGGQR